MRGGVAVLLFVVFVWASSCVAIASLSPHQRGVGELEKSLGHLRRQRISAQLQIAAALGVLGRLLPNHSASFEFSLISEDHCGGKECFLLTNVPFERQRSGFPEIRILGSSGVDILAGLHWYLKYLCGAHLSWKKTGGSQLDSIPKPGSLPRVNNSGVRVQRLVPWSYYQNVVTVSYSSVWWDWKRWEEEIDWMALQGINLPLAFTGQEAIWVKVFEKFNLTKTDLDDFFGGPAFLGWARMGNLHGWGGPLPQSWLNEQLALQKQILSRMFQLGMTPVLPAFSGNVPAALQNVFPLANITQLGEWNTVNGDKRWCCTYLLDPKDELFTEIGKAFILEQIKEYGWTSHIYNCDTFNENEPPSNDTLYISSLGAGVYEAMKSGDEDAIWLMQGWLFSSDSSFWHPPQMQSLLHSVPIGKLVILDLFADVKPIWQSSNQFYGVPYIWCMLHNFGGNIEMYGVLDTVASGPIEAKNSPNSTMVGVGMCMEGIEQNPVVYELMAEMAYRTETVNVKDWIKMYAERRYGSIREGVQRAWKVLHGTIYNCTDGIADHNTDVIVKLPDLDPSNQSLDNVPGHLWYSNEAVGEALENLLKDSQDLAHVSTYRYVPMQHCITGFLKGTIIKLPDWPMRLHSVPERLKTIRIDAKKARQEEFLADQQYWEERVHYYLRWLGLKINAVRNVMDMNAVYGGFAAAIVNSKMNWWVMNIVPVNGPNTLPVIYDRGLIGVAHDWCESFDTYPRTYDLLHAFDLFTLEKNRCNVTTIMVEMDRILRPGGSALIQDSVDILKEVEIVAKAAKWKTRLHDADARPYGKDKLLFCHKILWHA